MEAVLRTLDVVVDESFPDGGDYAGYSVASFRRRFRLSDGVAYPFLENRRLYRTDRRLSVADGTQGSDCSEPLAIALALLAVGLAALLALLRGISTRAGKAPSQGLQLAEHSGGAAAPRLASRGIREYVTPAGLALGTSAPQGFHTEGKQSEDFSLIAWSLLGALGV
ncbi:hypothetical protein EMIHUDRAFT_251484 [Emiliania huxleyi CCMP1516]|uniref:Uncharacterized protein n=2 Tax=Emiliania huxleyi TaxID=2903 RepID=A0A0D3KTR8_EMIH1|nr:hypothetical protein EMIHUDRAFT_251484 [Emiliania huxleyi CCMP1516]EOD39153.1 hypothetical protein EMIHUDRAFT_251484 [Emiliania huxleyi CCMP1516]|eukprot:XP_005791582.1 hypothetical protein EMIHUDRAFT_251484 [Emiliania huxleyi CCMP1516]